jgi:hypothetical protein
MNRWRWVGVVSIALMSGCAEVQDEASTEVLPLEGEGSQGVGTPIPSDEPTLDTSDDERPALRADAPVKKVLPYTWVGQVNGYYCGPASTRMALDIQLASPPSQQELAAFLPTKPSGGTAHIGLPVKALNKWLSPPTPYRTRPMDLTPTQAQRDLLKRDILERINDGYAIVANVLCGWRPEGYPSGLIGHYVTIVGYDKSGDSVLIADPAGAGAAGPAWKNVHKTYWITLEQLGTWIGGKGYAG